MKNRDIIIVGIQSWDIKIGSNCKNIATEFAKNNRVLYVNHPIDRLTYMRSKAEKNKRVKNDKSLVLNEVEKNLWVFYPQKIIESISSLSINVFFDILNKHNNCIFANEIKKAIKKLGFSNYILFCDSDMFRSFYLKELLKPEKYIYYSRDNLLAIKFWQTQGCRIEPMHMAKADMVMANSTYLTQIASKYNPKSFFVGQGCELSMFKRENIKSEPADISVISKPIIGYIGALTTLRLDIEIIKYLAISKPAWSIVLVGPEDVDFEASDLHNMSNVWFLGSKPENELPAYLSAFTVAINPQILNEVTIGNYPRKIDEYLVMGKPTVATDTVAMQYFKDFVSLVKDKDEWVNAVDWELENVTKLKMEKSMQFASNHTWENNVKEIYKLFEKETSN